MNRFILLFTAVFWAFQATAFEKPNPYQTGYLHTEINVALKNLIRAWQEEQFIEGIYRLGNFDSKNAITTEEFAFRMVSNNWFLDAEQPQKLAEEIMFYNFHVARIKLKLNFIHKLNPKKQSTQTFNINMYLSYVKGKLVWNFDLLELIRIPL